MKKKTIVLVSFILFFVLFVAAGYAYFTRPVSFEVTNYQIFTNQVTEPIRIAHLSDVHNREYGERNADLVEAVKKAEPQLIFITGDSVSMEHTDVTPAVTLVEELVKVAPVYFSYGNHDRHNDIAFDRNLGDLFEEAGAKVLEFEYEDITVRNQELRIGGLYGYCLPAKYLKTHEADPDECAFLAEFQDTGRYTMLLCHMPYSWIELDGIHEWDIDAVFAGHSHGGQMILPFLGPVYAPDQGWFPDWVSGQLTAKDGEKTLIVSRGLGDSVEVPRVNNDPELVIVDVVPE